MMHLHHNEILVIAQEVTTVKKLFVLLGALVLGATFAQDPIKIGVTLELSGRYVGLGTPELQGAQVAQQQMPEVLGRPVELSICDNATEVEQAVACANRFVDEGVLAVIGSGSSGMSIPMAEVLQNAGIIMVTPSSTNNATTQIGDYIFRVAYNDAFQGQVAAGYAYNEIGARKVAIFRAQDDDYSFGLAQSFADTFASLGGETTVVDFVANTVDFTAQVNDIRNFAPDLIYAPIFCSEAASLVPQLKQQGFADMPLLGADASDDPQCPEGGGDAFAGWVFTAFAEPDQLTGEAAQRAQDFKALFQTAQPDGTFNGFTLAGADAYNVIIAAIQQAGSTDEAAVRDALANLTDYPGVTGSITFAGTDGTPADRVMGFFEYQGGTYDSKTPLFDVNFNFGGESGGADSGGADSGGN